MGGADVIVAILGLAGGAAVGGALGGALMGALGLTGGPLRIAIGGAAVLGAMIGIFAVGGVRAPSLSDLFAQIAPRSDEAELQRVIKTYYPDDYQQAQSTLAALRATGASQEQTRAAMRAIALPLIERQIPLASTDNAIAYLGIARDEQRVLAANPDLCLRVMTQPSPDALSALQDALPADLKAREAHLAVQLLEQTATAPQPPKPPASMDSDLTIWTRDAFWGLSFDERDALTKGGALRGEATCDFVANLLNIIQMSGPTEAGEAFKAYSVRGMRRFEG